MATFARATIAGGFTALLAFAAPASAAPTNWDLSQNCSWPGHTQCVGNSQTNVTGNVYNFTGGGQTIQAEAYHIANGTASPGDPYNTKLTKDFLGFYSGSSNGLGAENTNAPGYGVDNNNGWDFIVFKLPANTYDHFDIVLSSWGDTRDMHATVLYGTPGSSLNISGIDSFQNKTLQQLLTGGFLSMNFDGLFPGQLDGVSGKRTLSLNISSPITYLIVAASLEPLRVSDNFLVNAIMGSNVVRVAEPASLAVFGMALIGLGGFAARRKLAARRA